MDMKESLDTIGNPKEKGRMDASKYKGIVMEHVLETLMKTAKTLASKKFHYDDPFWVDWCIQLASIGYKEYRDCIDAGDTEDDALRHAGDLMRAKLWD